MELDLECIVQVGGEEKSRASQKRNKESRPLGGKEIYDRVDFADRLQTNSMLPFHATKRKSACTKHVSSWSQLGNNSSRFF